MYITFHDEEWGNPVTDERKLFELLVLSQALAELTWPTILSKRDTFRFYNILNLEYTLSNRNICILYMFRFKWIFDNDYNLTGQKAVW